MATSIVHPDRIRVRRSRDDARTDGDLVVYWMHRSQRAVDNPALELAIRRANDLGLPLAVVFCAVGDYPDAAARHYHFMFEGLADAERALARRGVSLEVLAGAPADVLGGLDHRLAHLVTDRDHLPWAVAATDRVVDAVTCAVEEVEGDLVVPIERTEDRLESAARTIRPVLLDQLDEFTEQLRTTALDTASVADGRRTVDLARSSGAARLDPADPAACIEHLGVAASPGPVEDWTGGASKAAARLGRFLDDVLDRYDDRRNRFDERPSSSELSPYLHFGQISPVRVLAAVRSAGAPEAHVDAFVDELVVRRELAVNFVAKGGTVDRYGDAVPAWAQETLGDHRSDDRPAIFTATELEAGETDDEVWNAIMGEIRRTGWVHNQLRMYWGKQVIAWTNTPEHAFRTLLDLNNRWFLDGRDANSFANVAWCFGRHDRGFAERDVLGTVRPFTDAALRRKGDLDGWVEAATDGP